jgi:hypothetical protein
MQDGHNELTITCDACGVDESRDIDWLRENTALTCPGCGNRIDLRHDPWHGQIQRLWNASHHLGPPRRKLP